MASAAKRPKSEEKENNNEPRFTCEVCGKGYIYEGALFTHLRKSISCGTGRGDVAPANAPPAKAAVTDLSIKAENTSTVEEDEDVRAWSLPYTVEQEALHRYKWENSIQEIELKRLTCKRPIAKPARKAEVPTNDCQSCGQTLPANDVKKIKEEIEDEDELTKDEKTFVRRGKAACYQPNQMLKRVNAPLFNRTLKKREEREICMWTPNGSLSDTEISEFIRDWRALKHDAKPVEVKANSRDDQEALLALMSAGFDTEQALAQSAYMNNLSNEKQDTKLEHDAKIAMENAKMKTMSTRDSELCNLMMELNVNQKENDLVAVTRSSSSATQLTVTLPANADFELNGATFSAVKNGGEVRRGDRVVSINGMIITCFANIRPVDLLAGIMKSKVPVLLVVERAAKTVLGTNKSENIRRTVQEEPSYLSTLTSVASSGFHSLARLFPSF